MVSLVRISLRPTIQQLNFLVYRNMEQQKILFQLDLNHKSQLGKISSQWIIQSFPKDIKLLFKTTRQMHLLDRNNHLHHTLIFKISNNSNKLLIKQIIIKSHKTKLKTLQLLIWVKESNFKIENLQQSKITLLKTTRCYHR